MYALYNHLKLKIVTVYGCFQIRSFLHLGYVKTNTHKFRKAFMLILESNVVSFSYNHYWKSEQRKGEAKQSFYPSRLDRIRKQNSRHLRTDSLRPNLLLARPYSRLGFSVNCDLSPLHVPCQSLPIHEAMQIGLSYEIKHCLRVFRQMAKSVWDMGTV